MTSCVPSKTDTTYSANIQFINMSVSTSNQMKYEIVNSCSISQVSEYHSHTLDISICEDYAFSPQTVP